eukprot:3215538-Prymnesium_polylepis.3
MHARLPAILFDGSVRYAPSVLCQTSLVVSWYEPPHAPSTIAGVWAEGVPRVVRWFHCVWKMACRLFGKSSSWKWAWSETDGP